MDFKFESMGGDGGFLGFGWDRNPFTIIFCFFKWGVVLKRKQ